MILSIITINKDNKSGLERTLNSLKNQINNQVELIIIDGASKDGSLDVVEEYRSIIHTHISEKDRGIYNAMNKGVHLAKGDYIYFLNSGDIWNNNTSLSELIKDLKNTDFILCSSIWRYNSFLKLTERLPGLMNKYDLYDGVCHQSTFVRTELLKKEGFDEKYLTADWQFLFKKIYIDKATYGIVNKSVAVYDLNGISSDFKTQDRIKREKRKFLKEHSINLNKSSYFSYCLRSRLILKKIFMIGIWQIQKIKRN